MNYYVYAYLRKDGSPYYVGKGTGKRCNQKHYTYFYNSTIRWDGVEIPPQERIIFLIKETTEAWAHYLEMFYIDHWGRLNDGTGILENLTDGGEGFTGGRHTENSRRKISEAMKKRVMTDEHRRNLSRAMKGRKPSKKAIEKSRKACIGRKRTKETREKISATMKGRKPNNAGKKHSQETKEKMSKAHKGRIVSKETRAKQSQVQKGRIVSKETREKISKTLRNKPPVSKEHKQKVSEGVKKWWANRKQSKEES